MSFLGKIFNKGPKPIIAKSHEGNLDSLRAIGLDRKVLVLLKSQMFFM